jgi:tetratricopeptide (TPR) repeat protein
MKTIKKVLIVIAVILIMIGFHLTIRYLLNESFIKKYNQGTYDNKVFKVLKLINFPENYIVYYNEGNYYYQVKEYDKAIINYEKALNRVHNNRVCDVRHNLALTRLQVIDYDDVKNLRFSLIEVQDILLEDSCATNDNNGKHQPSQDLYNKIEELLKNGNGGGDPSDPGGDDPSDPSDPSDPDDPNKVNEIEQKIREQQRGANSERRKINRSNYEYYKGKSW